MNLGEELRFTVAHVSFANNADESGKLGRLWFIHVGQCSVITGKPRPGVGSTGNDSTWR